jgi:hypothetical protein
MLYWKRFLKHFVKYLKRKSFGPISLYHWNYDMRLRWRELTTHQSLQTLQRTVKCSTSGRAKWPSTSKSNFARTMMAAGSATRPERPDHVIQVMIIIELSCALLNFHLIFLQDSFRSHARFLHATNSLKLQELEGLVHMAPKLYQELSFFSLHKWFTQSPFLLESSH